MTLLCQHHLQYTEIQVAMTSQALKYIKYVPILSGATTFGTFALKRPLKMKGDKMFCNSCSYLDSLGLETTIRIICICCHNVQGTKVSIDIITGFYGSDTSPK